MSLNHYHTHAEMRGRLGMVIPAWYPDSLPEGEVRDLLSLTLADVETCCLPEHVVVVCDGQPRVANVAQRIAKESGERCGSIFSVLALPQNRGKGGAVVAGMEQLLGQEAVREIAVRDADGDHFVDDLPHLFRLARQAQDETQNPLVLAIGGRVDVHRPMGLARGEFERLANDVIWRAISFALARQGKVPNETYFAAYGMVPDLQSGFKLYSREAAELTCRAMQAAEKDHSDLNMARWGGEVVPVVEILLAGGLICQVNRITMEGQPVSAFGGVDLALLFGNKLLWTFRRLGLDAVQACALLDNASARSIAHCDAQLASKIALIRERLCHGLKGNAPPPHRAEFC